MLYACTRLFFRKRVWFAWVFLNVTSETFRNFQGVFPKRKKRKTLLLGQWMTPFLMWAVSFEIVGWCFKNNKMALHLSQEEIFSNPPMKKSKKYYSPVVGCTLKCSASRRDGSMISCFCWGLTAQYTVGDVSLEGVIGWRSYLHLPCMSVNTMMSPRINQHQSLGPSAFADP